MIEIKNLKKYYGSSLVIDDVSLEIKKGEIFAIVGHSGAGKSTLLRCINALESYQGGSLKVFDEEISTLSKAMPLKTHYSTCKFAAKLLNKEYMSKEDMKARVNELLKLVGLLEKATSYPSELSGGQKQRVAIARALALKPKILLSDEATSALDPNTTKNILELISKINKELGITVVLVTHEMEVVKEIAQKAILLEQGKIIGSGEISELFLKPNKKMRDFLGESDFLPSEGVNIKLYFPKEVAQKSLITSMARELNLDFNIVWGRIEKLNEIALGNLVINVKKENKDAILEYIQKSGVLWELADEF
ncbi:methionine ABC transporter ATP-binding protein [Campylobacter avium]|uniref:methionine ABC transporter ATP-binding protein n=1 Tax=Campylobacter avium TaxID=522485 RepID=UPI00248D1DA2|nr:methionine ABC transporter ATP-binding protein [Campylobacter avium]